MFMISLLQENWFWIWVLNNFLALILNFIPFLLQSISLDVQVNIRDMIFLDDVKSLSDKGKKDELDFIKIKNLLFKEYCQESERTIHRRGENIFKLYIFWCTCI